MHYFQKLFWDKPSFSSFYIQFSLVMSIPTNIPTLSNPQPSKKKESWSKTIRYEFSMNGDSVINFAKREAEKDSTDDQEEPFMEDEVQFDSLKLFDFY